MIKITEDKIEDMPFLQDNYKAGAGVIFLGTIRDLNNDKNVSYIVYHVYFELAMSSLEEIYKSCYDKFDVLDVRIIHRVGKVLLNEVGLYVMVSSVHRKEAFLCSQYIIDQIKSKVAIWKQEFYCDLSYDWIECKGCKHG